MAEFVGYSRMSLFAVVFISSMATSGLADRMLIERNARPLLAEGALEAIDLWETPLDGFFVRSHHNVLPSVTNDSWDVSFEGLLAKQKKISVKSLKKYPQVTFHAVLECSGNGRGLFSPQVSGIQWKRGAVGNAEWSGVKLADVLKDLGVSPEAAYVTVEGFDEPVMKSDKKFVRSIPLSTLAEAGAILAFTMNRQPIPLVHGGPVRLVIPGFYGQNWIKWVTKLVFSKEPDERMYAKKAYRMPLVAVKPGEAWDPVKQGKPIESILVQSIITYPKPDANLAPGKIVIRGKAFSGTGFITKVELSSDAGVSWKVGTLSSPKDYAWQEFEYEMSIGEGQSIEVMTRATDSKGHVQPLVQEWNPKGYLYNAADRVKFRGSSAGALLASGEALALTHCQTCHSLGMAEAQRLDKGDWVKVTKKMADYGLVLADDEVEKIATYFASRYSKELPTDDSKFVELSSDPSSLTSPGDAPKAHWVHGKGLFDTYCQSCHGKEGEGNIGPVLKGRSLSAGLFWSSVTNGKRKMPAFKGVLTVQQTADLRAWLVLRDRVQGTRDRL